LCDVKVACETRITIAPPSRCSLNEAAHQTIRYWVRDLIGIIGSEQPAVFIKKAGRYPRGARKFISTLDSH
jgi:hypothetical protein